MKSLPKVRKFQSPVWSEPVIMEMGRKGERGILIPETDDAIKTQVGEAQSLIPQNMLRKKAPDLPEVCQPQGSTGQPGQRPGNPGHDRGHDPVT